MRAARRNGTRSATMLRTALSIFVFAGPIHFLLPQAALSQGETTSAIIGQLSGASGAAVPGPPVTGTNKETGLRRGPGTNGPARVNFPPRNPAPTPAHADPQTHPP